MQFLVSQFSYRLDRHLDNLRRVKSRLWQLKTCRSRWQLRVTSVGPVPIHVSRGTPTCSTRSLRQAEDRDCAAGMRNPSHFLDKWPQLRFVMQRVRCAILRAMHSDPELRDLWKAFGSAPTRHPPSAQSLRVLRNYVCNALGLPDEAGQLHHAASPWRYMFVQSVQKYALDPDYHVGLWLQEGAPLGIALCIPCGGLFPTSSADAQLTVEELLSAHHYSGNHPSFSDTHGEA